MIWVLLALVAIVAAVWFARRQAGRPVRALIVLLREGVTFERAHLERAAAASGVQVSVADDQNPMELTIEGLPFRLMWRDDVYAPPGWDADRLASMITEARLSEAVREHRAFASLAIQPDQDDEAWTKGLPLATRLMAELVDENALVVWRSDTNGATRLTPEVRQEMRAGDVEAINRFQGDEVSNVDSDDPRLQAAVQEAKDRWPEFIEAVARIADPMNTIVKGRFEEGDLVEHMWVAVKSADPTGASGTLMNKPYKIRAYREGQEVTVPFDQVSDWAYIEGEAVTGAFSEAIVRGG